MISQWLKIAVVGLWLLVQGAGAETIRVMTFNIWVGGDAGKQPLEQTAEVIRAAKADIIGLQETRGYRKGTNQPENGQRLAEMLGWNYFYQGSGRGIISKFPIVTNTLGKWGVRLKLPSNEHLWMFNAHLMHAPYQPYQLVKIPYHNGAFISTGEEAVREAKKARGAEVERLLAELKPALATGETVFLTGDFNEPSPQDWTKKAVEAGHVPVAVDYPSVKEVLAAGMNDAFRAIYPDEVKHRGLTWTPTTKIDDPKDRHDRIDFIFVGETKAKVKSAKIVGEVTNYADVVVTPYPSDHRAVVAEINISN